MTIPTELKRSTPRSVSLTTTGKVKVAYRCLLFVLLVAQVTYIMAQPHAGAGSSTSWLGSGGSSLSPLWLGPRLGLGLVIFGCIGFWQYRRQMHLLANGRAVIARVTDDSGLWFGKWRRPSWMPTPVRRRGRQTHVRCEFPLPGGGVCRTHVFSSTSRPGPNDEIVVVYDPDEPQKAMGYPPILLKVDQF